jgi:hypothetical protein
MTLVAVVLVILGSAGVIAVAALPKDQGRADADSRQAQATQEPAPSASPASSPAARVPDSQTVEASAPRDQVTARQEPEIPSSPPPPQKEQKKPSPARTKQAPAKAATPPSPPPPSPPPPSRSASPVVKRLHSLGAEELRKELLLAPEVALDAVPNTSTNLVAQAERCRVNGEPYYGPIVLKGGRLDLACLPLQAGMDCVLGKEPAENLQAMSRKLRVAIESCIPRGSGDPRPDPEALRNLLLKEDGGWLKPEAVRCMRQMLAAENTGVRQIMVEVLSKIPDRIATETLAVTALTDLAPEVRQAAVTALKDRPRDDYRPFLVGGLSYPWNAVVAHAAEALAALDAKEATTALVQALVEPDPNLPITLEQGKRKLHVVRELVRVNHLSNCLLCHAPSFDRSDLVRGAVPIPGQALPGPATTPQYYETGESFVRADITYLRQHFSVVQPVLRAGMWPANQRFDYLVRLRPVTSKKELERAEVVKREGTTTQKELLRRAIKELTDEDPGTTPEDWRKWAEQQTRVATADENRQKLIEKEWGQFLPLPKAAREE